MIKRKIALLLFIILTIINVLIFIFREHFTYIPYATKTSLYSPCNESCINKWKQVVDDYPAEDLIKAKKITDSLFDKKSEPSIKKIETLSGFLFTKFNKQLGNPNERLIKSSPLDQYYQLCNNDSLQLWCGNFANMFAYFCWAQGIPCRIIEIMNPGDHHVINECYLPDTKQWIMVDITTNQLLTQNSNNSFIHVLDFKASLNDSLPLFFTRAAVDSMTTDTIHNKKPFLTSFYKKQNPLYYYYRINNEAVYTPLSKFSRYVFPVSWFKIYSEKNPGNLLFYVKQFFLLSWLITGVILVTLTIRRSP